MSLKIQRIIEDLGDPDPEIQQLALTTITRISIGDTVSVDRMGALKSRLTELCNSQDGDIAFLAKKASNYLAAGGRQTQQLSVAAVMQAAQQSPAPAVAPTPSSKKLMAELKKATEATEQATLLAQLRQTTDRSVLDKVVDYLQSTDDRVRANAVEVFESLGNESHISMLIPLLEDPNNRVKSNVVKALGQFGDPHVREYLGSMLSSDQVAMRESAVYAIAQLTKLDLEALLIRAASDSYEGVRLRAIKCLADSSTDLAISALTRRIDDNDAQVRQQAIEILTSKGVDVEELIQQRRDIGLDDPSASLPYISTPPAPASEEDRAFNERVRAKVEKSFKLEVLNIAQQLKEAELKARLSRLLFKIGVDTFELCRHGEIKDKNLLVHYYEITRYQDYLRSLSKKTDVSGGAVRTSILSAGLEQYRNKMRASFVRLGKALAQSHRSGTIQIAETPELRMFQKLVG